MPPNTQNDTRPVKSIRLNTSLMYPGLGTTSSLTTDEKRGLKLEAGRLGVTALVPSGTTARGPAKLLIPWAAIIFAEVE